VKAKAKKYSLHCDYYSALGTYDKPDWAIYEQCDRHHTTCKNSDHQPVAVFAKRSHALLFKHALERGARP
jgi:hypothetical protein